VKSFFFVERIEFRLKICRQDDWVERNPGVVGNPLLAFPGTARRLFKILRTSRALLITPVPNSMGVYEIIRALKIDCY
jgi:hypothetical protein